MRIEAVNETNFEAVLQLIAKYQVFYETVPDEGRNRAHFSRFWHRDEDLVARGYTKANPPLGLQFALYDTVDAAANAIGFATLYFPFSSMRAAAYCVMNDLFVDETARGTGNGRALIEHCLKIAHRLGFAGISWNTAQSNLRAQRLYDSLNAVKSAWFEYDLDKM